MTEQIKPQPPTAVQLAQLVDSITDHGLFLLDADGIVTSWHAGIQRLTGYAAADIVGRHFSMLYSAPDAAAGMPAQALRIAATAGQFDSEGWQVRQDGARFWAGVVTSPLHDGDGRMTGFSVIVRDLSQRETDHDALRQSEARFRTLVQGVTDHAIYMLAPTGEITNWHGGAERIKGYAADEVVGTHFSRFYNAHDRAAGLPARALEIAARDGTFETEGERVRKDGSTFPAHVSIDAIRDDAGRLVGFAKITRDITRQREAEEQVRRYQAELETLVAEKTRALGETRDALLHVRALQGERTHLLRLFEQAPGFVAVLLGADHVFELANQAYFELVGQRELVGRSVREALPDMTGQLFFDLLDNVLATGEPYSGRMVPLAVQRRAGSEPEHMFVDFIYQPIMDQDGRAIGIFVQGHDVTEQKLASDEVKRYQSELETLVSERTHALEQARVELHHAQKLESIGRLTGGVAHDFNNVLQIVGGSLQLLSTWAGANPLAGKRLRVALDAVERGARLSSQLLAFARRQPLDPRVINIARVIRDLDALLRQAMGEAVRIDTVIADDVWNTLADPHQLENAILNLAINACDAMQRHGQLTIEVGNATLEDAVANAAPHGDYVMLAISDTGTGMTPEVLERAVEPFFTTKPEGVGTGLGLSMVYGFVKQSGGHVRFRSAPGQGTTVRLYFPRSLDAATALPARAAGPLEGGNESILVVEDDAGVRAIVADMLGELGYRVSCADDAQQALALLRGGLAVDLLFTDVVMPGPLRSTDLAREAQELLPALAVLFTSGYTQDTIVHHGRLDPGVNLLSKPYRRDELAHRIRQVLAQRREIAAPAAGRTILVVEDDLDAQQLLCEALDLLGHRARGTASAEEAGALLAGEAFDVLFTDYSLPGMNGVEFATLARRQHPQLTIVISSGYGDEITGAGGLDAILLPKPYDLTQLEQAIAVR